MPSNTRRAYRGLAFGHPLRVSIFNHLAREGEASPKELATALGQPLGNVSYHVRELVNLGIMKGSRTASRRGAEALGIARGILHPGDGELGELLDTDARWRDLAKVIGEHRHVAGRFRYR